METIERVAELMLTIGEFSDLLDVENKAIQAADAATIAGLAERKEFLAMHYKRQILMLADRQAEVVKLDRNVRRRLGEAWKRCNHKIVANVEALRAMRDATQHVVTLIVDAIREAQSGGMTTRASFYRQSGAATGVASGPCVSITYNRVL